MCAPSVTEHTTKSGVECCVWRMALMFEEVTMAALGLSTGEHANTENCGGHGITFLNW